MGITFYADVSTSFAALYFSWVHNLGSILLVFLFYFLASEVIVAHMICSMVASFLYLAVWIDAPEVVHIVGQPR